MRITLDTNQLIRALVRPPGLATFMMAWESRRFLVVCSAELQAEYERVLTHPDITILIYPELLRTFRSHLQDDMEMVELPDVPRICRDPDDDKVIATAIYGMVDYLVTDDEDLKAEAVVEVLHKAGIEVMTMDALIMILG
ncbi:MAG TPA: putative toxin-antitoxin system toxin component, PIN family [Anaerolineales bacterium]|nr:putative toxin-antitoxin system toxin component, PIN family [Anaerolineales bacterium]